MPTLTFTYPEPVELRQVEQVLIPTLTEDDPIFDEFPIEESDVDRLMWEQQDNFVGLQQIRGLEGAPRVVRRPGSKTYDVEPGVYGEFAEIGEKELTQRRKLGTFDTPVNIDDLVGDAQRLLLGRRLDRIRYIIWTLLTSGTYSVAQADGTVLHTDKFPLNALSASVAWGTTATAVPTFDIQAAQLLSLGQSVNFGAGSKIYMNRVAANKLLQNKNTNDFFGRRLSMGQTMNNWADINSFLASNDLPEVVIYDRFYLNDSGTPVRFIPDDKAVLIGQRTNKAKLGAYRMTRNANNPRLEPGAYTQVIDMGAVSVPRRIHVHDGHNGAPVIFHPGAVVVISI